MKSDLSLLTILVATLTLPIRIKCCSYTNNQIISLMNNFPNYQRDPCYIQWKAEQDAKRDKLWKQRNELEKAIRQSEENQRRTFEENQRLALGNAYTSTTAATPVKKKQISTTWLVIGIIIAVLIGICCGGVCYSIHLLKDEDSIAIPSTTTPRNGVNTAEITAVVMTPEMAQAIAPAMAPAMTQAIVPAMTPVITPAMAQAMDVDAWVNQTILEAFPPNNPNVIGSENRRPFFRQTNVPLLPRSLIRKSSLPSYDEAVRMPSAPPKE